MNWIIRTVESQDIEDCARMRTDSWKNLSKDQDTTWYKETQTYERKLASFEKILGLVKLWDNWCYVYEWDDFIKGMIVFDKKVSEIWAVYVDPRCQWEWIGSKLFGKAKLDLIALGHEKLFLRVMKYNKASRGFYEKQWCVFSWKEKIHEKIVEGRMFSCEIVEYELVF